MTVTGVRVKWSLSVSTLHKTELLEENLTAWSELDSFLARQNIKSNLADKIWRQVLAMHRRQSRNKALRATEINVLIVARCMYVLMLSYRINNTFGERKLHSKQRIKHGLDASFETRRLSELTACVISNYVNCDKMLHTHTAVQPSHARTHSFARTYTYPMTSNTL